jgi:hypothetical protein
MIYSRFGGVVTLHKYCGMHVPTEGALCLTLCRATVTYAPGTEQQSAREKFVFAENLRADNGWREIIMLVESLPHETLDEQVLKVALEEAF